jgi:hypothetical protein
LDEERFKRDGGEKSSVGAIIFGVFFILHFFTLFKVIGIFFIRDSLLSLSILGKPQFTFAIIMAQALFVMIPLAIAGILVLLRKELGRRIALWGCGISILIITIFALSRPSYPQTIVFPILAYLPYGGAIYFFTRPKVRKQFK